MELIGSTLIQSIVQDNITGAPNASMGCHNGGRCMSMVAFNCGHCMVSVWVVELESGRDHMCIYGHV